MGVVEGVQMSDDQILDELGWSPYWKAQFEPLEVAGLVAGRVIRSDRGSSLVAASAGVFRAIASIRLLKATDGASGLPVVGDWVALTSPEGLETKRIDAVLQRRNIIARGDPGRTSGTQVLAANVEMVLVVHPIAEAPNLRRIERELSLAWNSGAIPVVVLTKSDLSEDPDASFGAVAAVAVGVDVVMVNALESVSVASLFGYIASGQSAVLIGPSGAGKSTLINALLGERRQATREVRVGDGRGRHTTVARELIRVPGHGVIIDTPGLRAISLTGAEDGIVMAFPDIEQFAQSCRFRDCRHDGEPGCAVQQALETGSLDSERLASYHKLQRENQLAALKTDVRARAEESRKRRIFSKAAKDFYKRTGRS